MSYASMGANKILNILRPDEVLMLAEGLHIFKARVPASLTGETLAETQIRRKTGCNVIAIHSGDSFNINPDPTVKLKANEELILIGTAEAEKEFKNVLS
jgi:K+/H+ antiporter YhaU regulatory subunit KhtT